jgi:hypothetical protein
MTKSSVRKAAPRNTHRNTTRKIGARKAHSGDRKTTSKVATEKARGTYRKTAARFEELAYDGQMPESMRALAEKSVARTRELYVHSLEAVLEGWERFVVAAGQGTLALNRKAIDITRRNINNGFGLAERLCRGEKPCRGYGIANNLLAQAAWRTGISRGRNAHANH